MLKILGPSSSGYCDGVSRRSFMKIGALGMGGLALPDFLRAQSASGGSPSREKSVIMVFLAGGPSHQDLWDIKEDAPSEIRGEFSAIPTSVPGVRICEHAPKIAASFEKFAALRSIVGSTGQHSSFQCESGHSERNQPAGGWPSLGAVLSHVQGASKPGVPPSLALSGSRAEGGFLGAAHRPFEPNGKGKSDMTLRGVTTDRLDDRKGLLASFDQFRREVDGSGMMDGMDAFNRQAFDVITSSDLVDALDLNKAGDKDKDRYLGNAKFNRQKNTLGQILTARRLVECGARCVTLNMGGWDTHGKNFEQIKNNLPPLDHGIATLVEDLHDRGLGDDVTVIVWGEFGRTPKVNNGAGRDHWPRVMGALMAGGGMRTGQAVGATDRLGGEAAERPIHVAEVFSTLYHNCGIDAAKMTFEDHSGRPQYLIEDQRPPIRELV